MKKVEAVVQGFKVDEVREILAKAKLPHINIFEVKGAGNQQGSIKQYRGTEYIEDSVEIKIEMVVDDDEQSHDRIIDALRTGDLSDGEVIILPVEQSVRLRAGQRGHRVRSWERDPAPSYLLRDATTLKSYLNAFKKKIS